MELSLRRALSRPLDPALVARRFELRGDVLVARSILPELLVPLELGIIPQARIESSGLDDASLAALVADFDACAVQDNAVLVAAYAAILASPDRDQKSARLALARGLKALRRLAHEKHRDAFETGAEALRRAGAGRDPAISARTDQALRGLRALLDARAAARSSRRGARPLATATIAGK